MGWFWNNILAVLLAVALGCFGHPVIGVIIALLIWCVPNERNSKNVDDVDEVEYEVHDADD